ARARVDVGAAIPLDAARAEVERGRAEVALLEAENRARTERLRLLEVLGIEALGRDVVLSTRLHVFEPPWSEEALIARAAQQHPELVALRATEEAERASLRLAKSQYLPSLIVSANWSGFARQAGSSQHLLRQIGRASCRERGEIAVGGGAWKRAASVA